jgi:uncharacterized protein YecE (DUF72 family)
MAGNAYIGLSGWSYDKWKDHFFQDVPRKQWLEHCAEIFTGLEANGTFYRLQSEKTLKDWVARTPDDFVFAAKGHRYVTHNKKLKDADETIVRSRDNMRPLESKLGAMLWQLPASFKRNDERLETFVRTLSRRWRSVRHALELRDPSWFTDETAELFEESNIANCQSDAADWPLWDAVTTDLVYIRLHGHSRTYASAYSGESLSRWADRIRGWLDEGRDVHVYFDNDAEGAAPHDAIKLMEKLGLR